MNLFISYAIVAILYNLNLILNIVKHSTVFELLSLYEHNGHFKYLKMYYYVVRNTSEKFNLFFNNRIIHTKTSH